MLLAAVLCAAAAPAAAQELPSGISLPEDRALAAQLADAEAFLDDGRVAAAVALLQEVASADPAALVRVGNGWLFRGAAETARRRLLELPEEARAHRRALVGEQAREELEAALMPPDLPALEMLARRYAGLEAGLRAEEALRELWLDRGYPERAATRGELDLPPDWRAALPAPEPRSPAALTAVAGGDDPALPRLRTREIDPSPTWEYRFASGSEYPQRSHRVALGHGLCFATDGREVVALELGSGEVRWRFGTVQEAWDRLDRRESNDMTDALSQHVLHAPVLAEGVLLAVLHEPVPIGRTDSYSRIHIRRLLPARRLYAFDARTGALRWTQKVPWLDGSETVPRELAAGPPAVAGGRVYLPVYDARGTIDASLLALDLRTGAPLWKRFLMSGQLESNLFGNVLKELAVPPPWADLDQVIVCTHLGAVSALDARTGAALWTRLYRRNEVRTFQSGLESERRYYFSNQPPGCDGERFLCAPVDGSEILLLDARDGALQAAWDVARPRNLAAFGVLRALVAMGGDVAWASGSRAVRLPLEGRAAEVRSSERLTDEDPRARASSPWPGVLVRGELLLPVDNQIERLDPVTLQRAGPPIHWPGRSRSRMGPLQATHGMLLVMRTGGITAHATPPALLDVLLGRDLTPRQLDEVLPLLDQFGFHNDRSTSQRVARAARALAEDPRFEDRSTDLRLLAGRAHLDGGEMEAGREMLGALLDAPDLETRVAAATLLVERLPGHAARAPELEEAMAELRRARPEEVQLRDGRRVPLEAFLARAALLIARKGGDGDALREALVDALQVGETGTLRIDGAPMTDWAQKRLAELAQDPRHRTVLEASAAARFASGAVDEDALRAYAPTEAAQEWLRAELDREDLSRAEWATRCAWAHHYGGPDTAAATLREPLAPPQPPDLPKSLTQLGGLHARGDVLLGAVARPGATFLFLQKGESNLAEVYRLPHGGQPQLHARMEILPPGRPEHALGDQTLTTENGVAVLYADQWVHLGVDGERRTRTLPGPTYTPPTRVGEFGAVLVPVGRDTVHLLVLDLQSGVALVNRPVDARVGRSPSIVHDGRHLFVLQAGSHKVLRFDLWRHDEPVVLGLDFVAADADLRAPAVFGEGVALTDHTSPQGGAVVHVSPGEAVQRVMIGRDVDFSTFRPARGIAWRSSSRGDGGEPLVQLTWLAPERETPWTMPLGRGEIRVPQAPRYRYLAAPVWQPDLQVLTLHRGRGGAAEARALRLGEDGWLWRSTLDGAAFDDLVSTLPQPQRCRDGWLLLLPHYGGPGADTRLDLLALDDEGRIVDRFVTPADARHSRSREIVPLQGGVLLRNNAELVILGNP